MHANIMNRLSRRAARIVVAGMAFALTAVAAWAQYGADYSYQAEQRKLMMMRVGVLFAGAFAGIVVGLFSLPALKPARNFLWITIGGAVLLYCVNGPSPEADGVSYLGAILFFIMAVALIRHIAIQGATAEADGKRPTTLGSAEWADIDQLRKNSVVGTDGFILGTFIPRNGYGSYPLRYNGSRHLLTVAPTRSGKGVSSIIPNLLTYPGSVFVVDPKGENALITAHRRGLGHDTIPGMKQNLVLLDPWDVSASKLGMRPSSFNPLDWIKADDPDAAENAFILADALVLSEGKGDSRYWDEEAKALLMGIILFVATAEEEKSQRTLGRVRDILTMSDSKFKATLQAMYKHPHPVVRSTASRQAAKEEKLYSSVLATAQSHTHFLDSGRIRECLARSNFRFEDLKTKPTTIYLILPADRLHTFDRWLRLLIQQAITVNARNIDQKPKHSILFLLDEMPTLGRLPAVEQAYGLMAGFGMQLWGIVQDLSQLAQIYGEHGWQTFISNSGVIQYFGSRDKMTAEYFSSLCGVTTVAVHSVALAIGRAVGFSSSFGPNGGSSSNSDTNNWSRTDTIGQTQRQLAYPDELMVLKGHQQIIFLENLDPISAHKLVWYKDAKLRGLGVNLHPELEKIEDATTYGNSSPPAVSSGPMPLSPSFSEPEPPIPFQDRAELMEILKLVIGSRDHHGLKKLTIRSWNYYFWLARKRFSEIKRQIFESNTP